MAQGIATSQDRQMADATYPADLQTVGLHQSLTLNSANAFLEKPNTATHLKIQALAQNIRYRIDSGTDGATVATDTLGFQLANGSDALIPVPNTGVSVAPEVLGAIIQYQWVY